MYIIGIGGGKETSYKYLELDTLFKDCDIIYICLAINDETKNIISDDLLCSMKHSCILISATGKQLFNSDLVENRIKNNELFGYAFEEPNSSLDRYNNNVMVTSEYGWFTNEASELRIKKWVELIILYLEMMINEKGILCI